ncbi:hypothetical protein CBR_g26011 [Chara braunii]|uniref:3-oxoacyl-[acyl-carrier-protein] synthase I, chloroplastic n=1 Tax=Chara braunii TaxID=69332 RepID=A0A388L717_CHABU|nr:hypothetical protein CBR_g26011 [Chara braunii]|eukprot:GBG78074.1 hypothetical protein CBR_g26011 [Chara braunii]
MATMTLVAVEAARMAGVGVRVGASASFVGKARECGDVAGAAGLVSELSHHAAQGTMPASWPAAMQSKEMAGTPARLPPICRGSCLQMGSSAMVNATPKSCGRFRVTSGSCRVGPGKGFQTFCMKVAKGLSFLPLSATASLRGRRWAMTGLGKSHAAAARRRRGGTAAAGGMAMATGSSSPEREKDSKQRVVITGMGLCSTFGNDVDTFYGKLLDGVSGVDFIDRFDASSFPTKFAAQIRNFSSEGYIDPKSDRRLDDSLKYALVSGKKALEDAHLSGKGLEKIDRQRVGVLVGSGMGGLTMFSDCVQALIEKGYRRISPFFIPYTITNMGSALLAIECGFMGPNYSISTACATSNYCIYAAANHIRRGEADVMLSGGTEAAIIPVGLGGFVACRALSTRNDDPMTASRPWDKGREGFVMGEGAGILVMESLEHAQKRGARIFAEYLGGAVTCDAHHMTDPRQDGLGVSTCIEKALEDSGVAAEEVNYINAHATSTIVGDVAELKAIKQVFKNPGDITMNATKSMIGHCLGAAGGLEAIATIKAIQSGWIHPTINQIDPEPLALEFDTVPGMKKELDVHVAVSNSFGFGGHNSCIVFAPFRP